MMQSKDNLETPITNNKLRITTLVTGATGFVGSHLVRRLIKEGWKTHIITRLSSNLTQLEDVAGKIVIHQHDGTTSSMINIVKEAEPEIVFHLASLFLAQHTSKDIEQLVQSNILFGVQLVEAMTSQGVTKLVNTGTSWQYFEDGDYNPVNLYAATKQAFEDILAYFVAVENLKVITLKLFDTYGPNDPRLKLFFLLKRIRALGEPLAMSPGEQLIDLVYADDVVSAFILAAERLIEGRVLTSESYVVSSGEPLNLREVVQLYEKVVGERLPIEWGRKPYRKREVMIPYSQGKLLPGWKVTIPLEVGLAKLLENE